MISMIVGRLHITRMLMISVKKAPINCITAISSGPNMPENYSWWFAKYFIIWMDWVTSFCSWMCRRMAHWKRATRMGKSPSWKMYSFCSIW